MLFGIIQAQYLSNHSILSNRIQKQHMNLLLHISIQLLTRNRNYYSKLQGCQNHALFLYSLALQMMLKSYLKLPQSEKYIVDMTATYTKEELVAALRSTFIGNSETLKKTTEYLAEASKTIGFCMAMMEIVDDVNLQVQVKQAALIQLKNTIKLRWQAKREQMDKNQKQSIRGALVLAVMRCHRNHKLIKLYKQIFTIITGYDYRLWLPVRQIVQLLPQDKDTSALLHILLAIAASFEFSISEEERTYFFEFLKNALPALQALLQRRPQPELIYLCIKFLWKAVHYQISPDIKQIACNWMGLLHAVIGATNPKYDQHPQDIQPRETEQFFYFHSKKWATRILLRFIQKHAKQRSYNKNEENKPFSEHWYAHYGVSLVNALIGQFGIQTTKKVRYFQLKCLQALINEKPDAVKQFAETFQYQVLLHYLRLQPEDEQLANRQPVEFLSREDQPSINFTNLKRVATDVWVGFAQLGSKVQKKTQSYEPGIFFYANMNYLQSKLQNNANLVEKQLAMYLICQLRSPITRCKQVKKILPQLIAKYVIPEFTNQIMFLRARAVDIFTEYGSMELDIEVVRRAVEGIYICLTKDVAPLVRIKAAIAFNCILKHKTAKDLVRPLLKDILTVYLQLLEQYDLQNIVNSLESIVEDFSNQIGPFSVELVKHLTKLFFKLFNKDAEQSNQQDYNGEAELAAAGCLKTITRIVQSPIEIESVTRLQPDMISILEFVFAEEGIDFIEDALGLLNAYLYKVPKVSGNIWFFYQVVVYNMVGIPKNMWPNLEQLNMPPKHKHIMNSIRSADNSEMMQRSMPVLRNYIQKSSVNTEPNHEILKSSIMQLLFYLIGQTYKRPPNDFSGELDLTCCTALLIYLLQNYQRKLPEQVYVHIYEFTKLNITKFKSKMMKILTSQLIGLLLWVAPTIALNLAHRDNILSVYLKQLVSYHSKYEMEHQRARVILGINSILLLPEKPQEIMEKLPEMFKTLVILVKKNAEQRVEEAQQDGKDHQSEESEDEGDIQDYNFDQDQEDFWEEQYGDNYNSALDSIDEILDFKTMIGRLSQEQPHIFSQLMKSVAAEDLAILQQKIRKALEKVEQHMNVHG